MTDDLSAYRHRSRIEMRWSDLDELRFINNSLFLTYFEQGRMSYFQHACQWDWDKDTIILAKVLLDYVKPLVYTDNPYLYMRCPRIGTKSFDLEYLVVNEAAEEKELVAKGLTVQVMYNYETRSSEAIPERIKEQLVEFEPLPIELS